MLYMLKVIDITLSSPLCDAVEKIYTPSFPDDERIPFERLIRSLSDTRTMTAVLDGDLLAGMFVVFLKDDLVYLAYLAVNPDIRSQGYGTAILEIIRKKYEGKRIVIDIEQQDSSADNSVERKRRKEFYLRAGYKDTGVRYFFYNVHYDLLSAGGNVKASDFRSLILTHWGPIAKGAVFSKVTL